MSSILAENMSDTQGHLRPYGGRYLPETLMPPLQKLEAEYFPVQYDPEFQRELSY
jgi:tryptophan synthase beta chain